MHAPAVGDILSALPVRQPLLRRGAIAAGALLAAGSVFGLTAAMNAPVAPPTSSGTYPDQGDPSGPASPSVLDAGQAAPSTWLPVAFPTLFPEANAPAAPQAPVQRAAAAAPAAPAQAASGGSAARQASAPATSTRSSTNQRSGGGVVDDTVDVVGNTVGTVGDTVREVGKDTPVTGGHRRSRRHGLRGRPSAGRRSAGPDHGPPGAADDPADDAPRRHR